MAGTDAVRTYRADECVKFRFTREAFGGLSNMSSQYPLRVGDVAVPSSEALYQACRFPHLPSAQSVILAQRSPMTAKMKSKPYRSQSRTDWERIKVQVMRWCLRVKLAEHWDDFGTLMLSTGDKPIVEESKKDDFWGAKPQDDGSLVGINALGRLLMELRNQLSERFYDLIEVNPLDIPDFSLGGKPIGVIRSDCTAAPQSRGLSQAYRQGMLIT
ncbi:MAG: NADAR family protein [Chloroflexi bacterium]|nr:NADAR family protein [Chloroflexota bacterium]